MKQMSCDEMSVPPYLLLTTFGERLQESMSNESKETEKVVRLTELSTSGVMGSLPGRFTDYNDQFVQTISDSGDILEHAMNRGGQNQEETSANSNRNIIQSVHYDEEMADLGDFAEEDSVSVSRNPNDFDGEEHEDGSDNVNGDAKKRSKGSIGKNYPLPTKWVTSPNSPLALSQNGLNVKFAFRQSQPAQRHYDVKCAKGNAVIPINCGVFYYEIRVLNASSKNYEKACDISLGFMNAGELSNISKAPGLENGTYGFHGADGNVYANHTLSEKYNKPFGINDVIGCGVNFTNKTIFYTKNGVHLGTAFKDVYSPLVAVIGMKDDNAIMTNFGQSDFAYNIEGYVSQVGRKLKAKIMNLATKTDEDDDVNMNASTGTLSNNPSSLDLYTADTEDAIFYDARALVASYFDYLGYVDVCKAFAEEISEDDEEIGITNVAGDPIDTEVLQIRQQIRNYLIKGQLDEAMSLTRMKFPSVFEEDGSILFELQCQKLIQLIKESKIDEAIKFGHSLSADLSSESSKQLDHLNDIFSLLAYQDPSESEFGYLLSNEEVLKLCNRLNGEILRSLGKTRESLLSSRIEEVKALISGLNESEELDSLLLTKKDLGID